jgi:hypothetical protein
MIWACMLAYITGTVDHVIDHLNLYFFERSPEI